jgi:putative hydrolase of the HAD superfamily
MKAVLFDLDDTLYDYVPAHELALEVVAKRSKEIISTSKEEFLELYSSARKHFMEELASLPAYHSRTLYFQRIIEKKLGKPSAEKTLELYNIYWETFLESIKPREGLIELLQYLKEKKIKVGIATNMTTYAQLKKIASLGISSYLDCIVTSNEVGSEKPKSPIFLVALHKIGCSASEALFVGDDPENDIKGARKVGMKTILIKTSKNSIDAHKVGADFVITNLLEIKNIL